MYLFRQVAHVYSFKDEFLHDLIHRKRRRMLIKHAESTRVFP